MWPLLLAASLSPHFDVTASLAEGKAGPRVAVTFVAKDPDVHVNEEPAPRLRLDPLQKVLVDKQPPPPARAASFDPETARYLDLARPVLFPVGLAPGAPRGTQSVKASVVYFYCSKREGWCRRGSADLNLTVTVP